MATAVSEVEWEKCSNGRFRHDWDKILDGQVWRLEKGKDYNTLNNITSVVYTAAKIRGCKAQTRRGLDHILVRAIR